METWRFVISSFVVLLLTVQAQPCQCGQIALAHSPQSYHFQMVTLLMTLEQEFTINMCTSAPTWHLQCELTICGIGN